ncbi:MAG TPA: 6-phosphogluconolactonase [Humisphaera sp.]|jgi:6-phosphogluconolactonase|nr:6-phosphogluconolactonase [Humisphaera sp.]
MDKQIKVLPDVAAIAHEAAEVIVESAAQAVAREGRFSIALSGGHTPETLFALLADEPYRSKIDWSKVEIFFGDERCVPPDSPQSNYGMAKRTMLDRLPIPPDQIHRMRGEIDPQEAAKEYGQMLKEKFGDGGLDLVLLGMGDDGHTASLFPGTDALHERQHRCVANHVPKLNTWRITLSAPFINRARCVVILVAGADKSDRLTQVLEGPRDPDNLPIQLIQPENGHLLWLIDAAAAGMSGE